MSRKVFYLFLAIPIFLSDCNQAQIQHVTKTLKPESKILGSSKDSFGQKITSWEMLGQDNSVYLAGLTIPMNVIEKSSKSKQSTTIATLSFPEETRKTTFINHVDIQFSNIGVNADLQQPSFAFRFYGFEESTQSKINCKDNIETEASRIPEGYQLQLPSNCEQKIGKRFINSVLNQNSDHPIPFSRINFGYYQGNMISIELVVTAEQLMKKVSFTLFIPTPKSLGRNTLFPTAFIGVYQPQSDSYDFSMWSFKSKDNSSS